jgi:hypothetical protein
MQNIYAQRLLILTAVLILVLSVGFAALQAF